MSEYEGVLISPWSDQKGKKTTATKLEIYSTYSPRSSIHFLARCSNFCSHSKKFRNLAVQPGLRGSNDLRVGRKMAIFQMFFFLVQGTGGSPMGPDPENRVGDQDVRSPGRPVSFRLQVPGEPGHCRARIRLPWWSSRGDFPSNGLQLHQQRCVVLRVDSWALWNISNEEDAVLIPKNRGENFSSGFLH